MPNKAYAVVAGMSESPLPGVIEYFSGSSVDSGKWTTYSSGTGYSVSEAGGQLQFDIAAGSGYAGVVSADSFDLTGRAVQVKFSEPGNSAAAGSKANLEINVELETGTPDSSNAFVFAISEGTIGATVLVGGTKTNLWITDWSDEYQYVRVREAGGTVYFDTSSDGIAWVNRATVTPGISVTALYADIHYWNFDGTAAAATAGVTDYAEGMLAPAAVVSAVTTDGNGSVTGEVSLPVSFADGSTEEDVREAVYAALRQKTGDSSLDVSIL